MEVISMNEVKRNLRFNKVLLLALLLLISCSKAKIGSDHSLMSLPSKWQKYLSESDLSAELRVYNSGQELVHTSALILDLSEGTVSSEQFQLTMNQSYRFVIDFIYLYEGEKIVFAYLDAEYDVGNTITNLSFNSQDIVYDVDASNENLSVDISQGILANLDTDGDGWSNFEELKDKVNPLSSSSIPLSPSVELESSQVGNVEKIRVIAKDNARIETIALNDPLCGVQVVKDETVELGNGQVQRVLDLELNLLTVPGASRIIQASASDGVTSPVSQTSGFDFELNHEEVAVDFAFTSPELNQEIEGNWKVSGIACSRETLNSIKIIKPNQGENLKTEGCEFECKIEESIDTNLLADGLNTIEVEVSSLSKSKIVSLPIQVNNQSILKVDLPKGRRFLYGKEVIQIVAAQSGNVAITWNNQKKDFEEENINVEQGSGFIRIPIDVSSRSEGDVLNFDMTATLLDGSQETRRIQFTVQNNPQIETSFASSVIYPGWSTDLAFKVTNTDKQVKLNGTLLSEDQYTCHQDESAPDVQVCEGTIRVTAPEDSVSDLGVEFKTSRSDKEYDLFNPSLALKIPNNNIPLYGANCSITGTENTCEKEVFKTDQDFMLSLYDSESHFLLEEGPDLNQELILNNLSPRQDYRAELKLLDGAGFETGSLSKSFTTSDDGLVAWYRFKEDPNGTVCSFGDDGETLCDYSGFHNHGFPHGDVALLENLEGAWDFDGNGDYATVDSANSLDIQNEISILSTFIIRGDTGDTQMLVSRDNGAFIGNYSLSYQPLLPNVKFVFGHNGSHIHFNCPSQDLSYQNVQKLALRHKFGDSNDSEIYVNDNLISSSDCFWELGNGNETPTLVSGSRMGVGVRYADGSASLFPFVNLFDLRIYNRYLSDDEMLSE